MSSSDERQCVWSGEQWRDGAADAGERERW